MRFLAPAIRLIALGIMSGWTLWFTAVAMRSLLNGCCLRGFLYGDFECGFKVIFSAIPMYFGAWIVKLLVKWKP